MHNKISFDLRINFVNFSRTSGYAPQNPLRAHKMGGGKSRPHTIVNYKKVLKSNSKKMEWGHFLLGEWRYPSLKQLKTFPGLIRSFTTKEINIDFMLSEIL